MLLTTKDWGNSSSCTNEKQYHKQLQDIDYPTRFLQVYWIFPKLWISFPFLWVWLQHPIQQIQLQQLQHSNFQHLENLQWFIHLGLQNVIFKPILNYLAHHRRHLKNKLRSNSFKPFTFGECRSFWPIQKR